MEKIEWFRGFKVDRKNILLIPLNQNHKENNRVIVMVDMAPGFLWAMRDIFILQKHVTYHCNFVFYNQKLSKVESLINR